MNTKIEYKNNILKLMIEDDGIHTDEIKAAYYHEKEGNYLVKTFEGKINNIDKISSNFTRLIPTMFEESKWEEALLFIAEMCKQNNITWFLTGSACDAVRGIEITPHDLDIEILTDHWRKVQEVFEDYIVEPFVEVKGWARENFGRLVVNNTQVDMVADKRFDLPMYEYEPYVWNGYTLWLEPFMLRYKTEINRQRTERIEAIKNFLEEGRI